MFYIKFLNYRTINSNEKWCLIMRLSIAPQRPYNNKPQTGGNNNSSNGLFPRCPFHGL